MNEKDKCRDVLIMILSVIKWNQKDWLIFFAIWNFSFVTDGEIEHQTWVWGFSVPIKEGFNHCEC